MVPTDAGPRYCVTAPDMELVLRNRAETARKLEEFKQQIEFYRERH